MTATGRAIAVLGTGVDVCDPKENKKLYEKVLEGGAILSEFPLGTHPAPENFPIRNRIVAGMPLGAIIIEGAQYSGSLITARLAMQFGREVFGVPGNVRQGGELCAEPFNQARSQAGHVRRGRDLGAANAGARGAFEAGTARSGATQSAGGAVADRERAEDLCLAEFGCAD
jgi:hypothetical protein